MSVTRITKVDWDIINAALAYHEAASWGEEEMEDEVPEGFRSWGQYHERAQATRRKVSAKLFAYYG